MTHWLTLDDWDSDGIPKTVDCHCDLGADHHQLDEETGNAYGECRKCQAEMDEFGRCWYCDRGLVWREP